MLYIYVCVCVCVLFFVDLMVIEQSDNVNLNTQIRNGLQLGYTISWLSSSVKVEQGEILFLRYTCIEVYLAGIDGVQLS